MRFSAAFAAFIRRTIVTIEEIWNPVIELASCLCQNSP